MQIELDENDDLLPEYDLDFSKAKPNRFAEKYNKMARRVTLDSDIADEFPTDDAVNEALRQYVKMTKRSGPEVPAR